MVRTSEPVHTGHIISGIGHVGIIGWALLGSAFQPAPPPLEVREVAVISSEAFERMTAPPQAAVEVALPQAPSETAQPSAARAPDPVEQAAAPPVSDVPEPDPAPEAPPPQPLPELTEETPELPAPEPSETALVPKVAERPVPRSSERVAPEAVEAPDPDVTPDPVEQAAVTPGKAPAETPPVEEQQETAREEAAEQITPETEPPSVAPTVSRRPPSRRPPPPTQTAVAEPEPEKPGAPTDNSAVNAALNEALASNDTQPDVPVGPPLTGGEEEGFLRQVEQCWNIASLSTEARQMVVTVAFSLDRDGVPVSSSLKMITQSGGSETAARKAYETARRAILRCGRNGYEMPDEKYAHWKDIELTFNPEKMRLR